MKTLKVLVQRGSEVESEHLADLLVLNSAGQSLFAAGEIERCTFPRSAIKPFQAMLLASVRPDPESDEDHRRLAISAASHWAEEIHIQTVRQWLGELGFRDDDLICGPQTPRDLEEQRRLILTHQPVCRVHNNCSGKHSGFLEYCQHQGYEITHYGDYEHPLQKDLRTLMDELTSSRWSQYVWATDGCGIPTYHVPLPVLARLGTFVLNQHQTDERLRRVLKALRHSPEMISGRQGFCTQILRESQGQVLVKTGAEGNFWGADMAAGFSFFLKIRDGSTRASEHLVLWLLKEYGQGAISKTWLEAQMQSPLINWAGEKIGQIRLSIR